MIWFCKKEPAIDRKKWIGCEVVAAVSLELKHTHIGAGGFGWIVTQSKTISGKVTNVGQKTIQIDDAWYEEDWTQPQGVRIIEIVGNEPIQPKA